MSKQIGLVALDRIAKRHHAAIAATRNGAGLNTHTLAVLLTEMGRLIEAHDELLARVRAAQVALDPSLRLPAQ
jgi:hypothetical protein